MPMIRMLETTPGSDDGISRQVYEKDKEYPVGQDLAEIFVNQMEVAVYMTGVELEKQQKLDEEQLAMSKRVSRRKAKAIVAAPENEAIEAAPENEDAGKGKKKKKDGEGDEEEPGEIESEPGEEESGFEEPKSKVLRVYELADELGKSSKDILILVENLGIYARSPASGLSQEEIDRIKANL